MSNIYWHTFAVKSIRVYRNSEANPTKGGGQESVGICYPPLEMKPQSIGCETNCFHLTSLTIFAVPLARVRAERAGSDPGIPQRARVQGFQAGFRGPEVSRGAAVPQKVLNRLYQHGRFAGNGVIVFYINT